MQSQCRWWWFPWSWWPRPAWTTCLTGWAWWWSHLLICHQTWRTAWTDFLAELGLNKEGLIDLSFFSVFSDSPADTAFTLSLSSTWCITSCWCVTSCWCIFYISQLNVFHMVLNSNVLTVISIKVLKLLSDSLQACSFFYIRHLKTWYSWNKRNMNSISVGSNDLKEDSSNIKVTSLTLLFSIICNQTECNFAINQF